MARTYAPLVFLLFFTALLSSSECAFAARKKNPKAPRPVLVEPSDITNVNVSYKLKKKKKPIERAVACYQSKPGMAKASARGLTFMSFASQIKTLKKKNSRNPKIPAMAALAKAGAKACKNGGSGGGGGGNPGGGGPAGDHLSLDPYTGPYTEAEAKILFDRFAFAGTPAEIAASAQMGLAATVQSMTTAVDEPVLDAIEGDLRCDGRLASDPNNETCDPGNPNDLDQAGVRYGIYYRVLFAQKPFFDKLFFFLHDERLAVSTRVVGGCSQHSILSYVTMLRKASRTGDYVQYMRDWNNDMLGHLIWLDGQSNKAQGPNENYAREFWELGTTGPTNLDGTPVYGDRDIAQSALAFTGWRIQGEDINGNWVCLPAYVPGLHAPGSFMIFTGTPWAARVSNAEEVLVATFAHPRTAESLAEDIWKEFINPYAGPAQIRALAEIIRNENYNLVNVLRRVMISKAMFAEASRKSLIKHPWDKLFGFLRMSKLPVRMNDIDWMLRDLDQRPLQAPTVFGWNEHRLAGEVFVLEYRNTINWLLTSRNDENFAEQGYNFHAQFLSGLQGSTAPSLETINRVASWMNVSLNDAQRASLVQYMDFDLERCWDPRWEGCQNGEQHRLRRNVFDPYPTSNNWSYKLRGLLSIIAGLPEANLK